MLLVFFTEDKAVEDTNSHGNKSKEVSQDVICCHHTHLMADKDK